MSYHCACLWFGLGGSTEQYRSNGTSKSTLHGYDQPETWHPRDDAEYTGAVVIDKRPALEQNPGLAVSMPMCDADLTGNQYDCCPQPSPSLLAGLQGSFKTLAAARALDKEFSGLDSVSPETYGRLWSAKGARVGRVEKGAIVWD